VLNRRTPGEKLTLKSQVIKTSAGKEIVTGKGFLPPAFLKQ
jgi:hypothetical protein